MKKILIILLFISSFSLTAQEQDKVRHHELKANAFNLIVFKSVDFSYEYLIDSESSIGVSILANLQNEEDINDDEIDVYYNETLAITPFYRRFFSRKHAWGFFLETFAMYNKQKDFDDFDYVNNVEIDSGETSDNFALGLAVGGKFVTRKGFAFEFFGGVGRNLSTSNNDVGTELVPRLGASLGYRF